MSTVKANLTGAQETLLATLYGRALDSRAKAPVLGDTRAADMVRRIDYDFRRTGLSRGDAAAVALRARQLDAWTADFLAAHPEATVLHLGCGLDTRFERLDPPSGVRWYDIDHPDVIDLRRRLCPPRKGYEMIGSSVADPAWLAGIPADRPAMVVAEGLTMYLTEEQGRWLVPNLVDHFPGGGRMAFDVFSRFGIRLQKLNTPVRRAGATLHWGVDDGSELERLAPRLHCVAELTYLDVEGYEKLPLRYRFLLRAVFLVPGVRRTGRLLLYRF
ncbi:class I SAM-dependent methyltransferase [Streptomyces thermolineatus]|uniref:Class I SAM-dependent methyltransferase n=1 Tax=Streptomyces thermolineatus TaxID=44033 RepID=A0ABP6A5Y3_9ACTN